MKTRTQNGHDLEQTEHERWTNAIMKALHELRSASAAGLDRHGYLGSDAGFASFLSPLSGSMPPGSARR